MIALAAFVASPAPRVVAEPVALAVPAEPGPKPRRVLRGAADPNNLPFTNDRREGFENKNADLVARELGADLVYTWRAQRRGFFRAALKEGEADLVLGVPKARRARMTSAPGARTARQQWRWGGRREARREPGRGGCGRAGGGQSGGAPTGRPLCAVASGPSGA